MKAPEAIIPLNTIHRYSSPKRRTIPEQNFNLYSVNCSQAQFRWQLKVYRQARREIQDAEGELAPIHGGSLIYLKHAQSGGYLNAEELDFISVRKDERKRVTVKLPLADGHELPGEEDQVSTNSIFEVELSESNSN